MRVPVFKEELYYDDPLGESAAKPCTAEEIRALQSAARVEKKYGQRLHGDMIPKRG